jgi:fermentation-respiration switch protein FrsA (DUF1100 family)
MRMRLALIVGVLALAALPAVAVAADPPTPAFGGPLSGAQEVPAVVTAATGEGTAVISTDGSTITYYVTYSGLSGPAVAAHIHTGAPGVAGGVILPLVVSASPMVGTLTAANFAPSGAITTFAQAVAAIRAGNTYFNIHTAANPGGEVRGQIVAKGNAHFASLGGFQEVPPVVTPATGHGWVLVSTDGSTITYYVAYSGLSGPAVAAHIHTGAAGVAGGVILPLVVSASPMVGTLTAANFAPSGAITTFAQAVAAIGAGNTYFNIHTAANPGGEVRGQIGVTVAAPAPSPAPTARPSPAPTARPTVPPTSTLPVEPASGGSAVPAVIGILAFLSLMSVASRRFALRSGR